MVYLALYKSEIKVWWKTYCSCYFGLQREIDLGGALEVRQDATLAPLLTSKLPVVASGPRLKLEQTGKKTRFIFCCRFEYTEGCLFCVLLTTRPSRCEGPVCDWSVCWLIPVSVLK